MKVEVNRAVKVGGQLYPRGSHLSLTREQIESLPEGTVTVLDWHTDALRTDGPTFEEYVAEGYPPENYPPRGYAEQESPGWTAYRREQDEDQAARAREQRRVDPVRVRSLTGA